jgi:hypothetical protein
MAIDLSVLDEAPSSIDLSVLDEPKSGIDLSVLDNEQSGIDLSVLEEEEPGIGRTVAGLGAEVVVGEGAKLAGAALGAKAGASAGAFFGGVGAVPGALIGGTIGYFAGGVAGGVGGSLLAQEIEGRDEASWGRVTADTALNLIPGGLGKASKGARLLPRLAKEGTKRAAGGALISTAGAQIEKGVEEGELLTNEELGNAVLVGGGLGLGLGAAGQLMKKAYPKFGGKAGDYLNKAYEKGDPDAAQVVETLAGENPVGMGSRFMRSLYRNVIPSKLIGGSATMNSIRAKNEAEAATDLAATVRNIIDGATKKASKTDVDALNDYVANNSNNLPAAFTDIKGTLDDARVKIDQYQNTIYRMYKSGDLDIDPRIAAKIKSSIDSKNYFTREYRFYEDSNYRPSANVENKLRMELKKDGQSDDEINQFLQNLQDSRSDSLKLMNTIAGNKRVFKRKNEDLTETMREYLGEYTESGERLFGTISRLGRLASYEAGNRRIADDMLKYKIGQTFSPGQVPDGFEPLVMRGRAMRSGDTRVPRKMKVPVTEENPTGYVQSSKLQEGDPIYVPKEANQALQELYGTGAVKDSGPWLARVVGGLLKTTTAAAKFAVVPLNLASYPVQLVGQAVLVAGQGFNPGRGYGKGMRVAINESLPQRFKRGQIPLMELNRLKELGLVDKGVTASDIRDGFKNGIAPKLFQRSINGVGKAYNSFDTAQRISVYENYKKFLGDIIPEADIKRMGQREFEQIAGDLTNNTYTNYDRINKGLRSLSQYGILNEFGAFNFELVRTTFNQAKLAKQMTDGTFPKMLQDKYGVQMNDDTLRRIKTEGFKRMAALSAILTAGSTVPMVLNRDGGIDSEKEEAMRETVFAPWEENQSLHIRKDGNKIRIANLGYQIPTAELSSVVDSALRGDNFMSAAGKAIDSMWSKFGGDLTINMKNIVAAVNNMDANGRRISDKVDGLSKNLDLVSWYMGENFTPGTFSDFQKLDERTTADNVLRYTLGYRVRNLDMMESAGYKFRDIRKGLKGISSKYNSSSFNDADMSGSYQELNKVYRSQMEQGVRHVNNLRTLDATEQEIKQSLSKTFTKSDVENIMTGNVPDMSISTGVPSNRIDKRARYVQLAGRMPEDMAMKMLQDDYDKGKLKRSDVQAVMRQIQMKQYPR